MHNLEIINLISLIIWIITWVIVGKFIFDHFYYRDISIEKELLSNNNGALAFSFAGFMVGFIIAVLGSVDLSYPIYINAISGFVIMFLILFFTRIFDWIFLKKIDLPTQIISYKNISGGILEGSIFLSMGIIIAGAFSGEGPASWVRGYGESILYCTLALVFFYLALLFLSLLLKVDVQKEAKQGNRAVSIGFAGMFIAVSLDIRYAISGAMEGGLLRDMGITLLDFLASITLMIVFFYVFDLILFKKFSLARELKEPNLAAGVILAGIFIISSTLSYYLLP